MFVLRFLHRFLLCLPGTYCFVLVPDGSASLLLLCRLHPRLLVRSIPRRCSSPRSFSPPPPVLFHSLPRCPSPLAPPLPLSSALAAPSISLPSRRLVVSPPVYPLALRPLPPLLPPASHAPAPSLIDASHWPVLSEMARAKPAPPSDSSKPPDSSSPTLAVVASSIRSLKPARRCSGGNHSPNTDAVLLNAEDNLKE